MYYVEVPRILILWSNFPFIPSVEFLEIFQFLYKHIPHTCYNLFHHKHIQFGAYLMNLKIFFTIHLVLPCLANTLSLYTP